ncbi:oxidoreductase [Streptomyces sp. NBC_00063]|uniref:oxidoreductase n=1 Tax=Streptomyces sp. NBC_00063 TaxID=2975638 RepID=UPI0022516F4A|nr:oxidoreductase [Streptomyces sp. NBC_00063]MCX5441223.1 oxidoreductase [Streptomyces sp. NBC_00063]
MYTYEQLTSSERQVWDAYPAGHLVDFRTGGAQDAPDNGEDWGVERTIRATVVATLLLGGNPGQPGNVPALRLAGARISGALDLSEAEIGHGMWFEGCWFEQDLNLFGAETRTIEITDSRLAGLTLTMARVAGRVVLRRTVLNGRLSLMNARLSGELKLRDAVVSHPGDWAVFAGGLVMEAGLFCRGTTVHGGIRLPGAQLPGGLHMEQAQLHHPDGVALLADQAVVSSMALSQGFTAEGTVSLRGTQITDQLTLDGATLRARGTALDCARMQAGIFVFTPAEPPSGQVDLQNAQAVTVHDRESSWPETVRLQGFTYGSFHESGDVHAVSVERRLAWIRRQPNYAAQPYEQLAAWYRVIGHDDDARRVLLAKQRQRRGTLGLPSRLWGHLIDATVGYGYRPWLAGVWLAALVLLGTTIFAAHTPRPTQPGQVPPFNPFVYTLDLLIPIGGLGQRTSWYWMGGATAWLSYALIAAGWILTTAVLAGITRTLSRN